MKKWSYFITILSLVFGSFAFAACGDDGGDDGGDGDGNSDDGGSNSDDGGSNDDDGGSNNKTESYTCCLNGAFHECPSSKAVSECNLEDGPGDCDRVSSRDDECN